MDLQLFLPLIFLSLHLIHPTGSIYNLRRLTKKCATAKAAVLYCGTFPADCEKKPDYSCEFITTIEKFEIDCPSKDLRDPYLHILCTKQKHTYLVNMLRLLPSERACTTRKQCSMSEYVALSMSVEDKTATVEDSDLFYVCTADSPHITSWTRKGTTRVLKHGAHAKHPFQAKVYNMSGIGVYWENLIGNVPSTRRDFVCEFVISLENEDLDFKEVPPDNSTTRPNNSTLSPPPDTSTLSTLPDNSTLSTPPNNSTLPPPPPPPPQPSQNNAFSTINLSKDKVLYLKMIQGLVERSEDNHRIIKVIMNETELHGIKPITLSKLMVDRQIWNHTSHARGHLLEDERLHKQFWDPLFQKCRKPNSFCYLLDLDPGCLRLEKEECTLIVNFKFINNFTQLRVQMTVENWQWGGFAFSTDRIMADDIGFYCTQKQPQIWPQIHFRHTSVKGDDTALDSLVTLVQHVEQMTEMKRYCEWIMPSKFKVHQGPYSPNDTVLVDLLKQEYHVMVAVGNTQEGGIGYHAMKEIQINKFSKKNYVRITGVKDTTIASGGAFSVIRHYQYPTILLAVTIQHFVVIISNII